MSGRRKRWLPTALAGAMLAAGFVSMGHVSRRNSPAWDEVHLWGIGYYLWWAGRFDTPGVLVHPPLGFYLNSLPLLAKDIPLETAGPPVPEDYLVRSAAVNLGRGNLIIERHGYDSFLASRVPFVVVYCALGLLVFLWARRWWGASGGLFSLALFLVCPNLMAHGFLVTTDFLSCATVFAALYFLVLALERPGARPLALFVAAFALAPAARFTGLLVGPLSALCVLVWAARHPRPSIALPLAGPRRVSRGGFLLSWAAVAAVALGAAYAVLVLLYQGDPWLHAYRLGIEPIRRYVRVGHPVFLDGRVDPHGFADYYLKAIPYKTAPVVLAAWALSVLVPARGSRRRWLAAFGLGVLVVGFFSLARFTQGLRYPLVFFPLMYVASGRLVAPRARGGTPWTRLALGLGVVLLAFAELASAYPHPRAYVNRLLVRGPRFAALADSDIDSGEGLIALRDYVRAKGLPAIALSYHGAAWPELFEIPCSWLESTGLPAGELGRRPRNGLLFVSSTTLSGLYRDGSKYAWLRPYSPVDVVGGGIYVYDLDRIPEAARWSRTLLP